MPDDFDPGPPREPIHPELRASDVDEVLAFLLAAGAEVEPPTEPEGDDRG